MPQRHVSETMQMAKCVGGLMLGQARAGLVNGDLTSEPTAEANVDTRVAKLHTSEKLVGIKTKASLRIIDQYVSGYTSGGNVGAYSSLPSNVQKGGCALVL